MRVKVYLRELYNIILLLLIEKKLDIFIIIFFKILYLYLNDKYNIMY